MKPPTSVRTNIGPILTAFSMAFCITGCAVPSDMRREPNTTLVRAIELHGGKFEYHRGIGVQNEHVKAISLPAAALQKIDPVTFHVFPRLQILHLTDIPTGAAGETYETACCVTGKEELTKLAAEYRKAGLMR